MNQELKILYNLDKKRGCRCGGNKTIRNRKMGAEWVGV